jgi:hypothetical protein
VLKNNNIFKLFVFREMLYFEIDKYEREGAPMSSDSDYYKQRLAMQKENDRLCEELSAKIQEAFDLLGAETEYNKEDFKYIREFSERHEKEKAAHEIRKYDLMDELFEIYYNQLFL